MRGAEPEVREKLADRADPVTVVELAGRARLLWFNRVGRGLVLLLLCLLTPVALFVLLTGSELSVRKTEFWLAMSSLALSAIGAGLIGSSAYCGEFERATNRWSIAYWLALSAGAAALVLAFRMNLVPEQARQRFFAMFNGAGDTLSLALNGAMASLTASVVFLCCALVLGRLRLPGTDVGLLDMRSTLRSYAAADAVNTSVPLTDKLRSGTPDKFDRVKMRRRHVVVGVLSALAAFAMLGLHLVASERVADPRSPAGIAVFGALVLSLFLAAFAGLQFWRAVVFPIQSAYEALSADPRRPVVWLRSFRDEDVLTQQQTSIAWLLNLLLSPAFRPSGGHVRVEDVVAANLKDAGPFIAIGAPQESKPTTGAARIYLKGEAWQGTAADMIDRAGLIMMLGGTTEGLGWEIQEIIERQRVDRMVVILLEADRAARLAALKTPFQSTPWAAALGDAAAEGATALAFGPDGRIVICNGSSRGRTAFEAVMLAGAVHSFRMRGEGGT